jgi:hypothetical protein
VKVGGVTVDAVECPIDSSELLGDDVKTASDRGEGLSEILCNGRDLKVRGLEAVARKDHIHDYED